MDKLLNNYLSSELPIMILNIEGLTPIKVFYNGTIEYDGSGSYSVTNKVPAMISEILTSNIEK